MDKYSENILQNLKAFYRFNALWGGYRNGVFYGAPWFFPEGNTWPSSLVGAVPEQHLSEAKSLIENRELPPVWVVDKTHDIAFYNALKRLEFYEVTRWTGMYLLPADYVDSNISHNDLVIESIKNEQQLQPWLQLLYGELLKQKVIPDAVIQNWFKTDKLIILGGYVKNELASIGLAFIHEKVAGLYFIATQPRLTRKGYASQLVRQLIERAFENGAETICLQASFKGEKLYERLGFKAANSISVFWKLGVFG